MTHRTARQVFDELTSEYPNASENFSEDSFLISLGFTDPEVRDQMKITANENAAARSADNETAPPARRDHDAYHRSATAGYDGAARIARSTIRTATYSSMM